MTVPARGTPPAPTVLVNGRTISRAAITREMQHHSAPSLLTSWRLAAEALVLRELMLQEIARAPVAVAPQVDARGRRETDEEAAMRALIAREVTVPEPTAAELRRYYAANQARFRSAALVEARHILLAARAADPAAFAAARTRAAGLSAALAADPASFAELARRHSDCASAADGGCLGLLDPADTTPEFAAAVAGLAEGETTRAPVEARYGVHLIRLDRRLPAAVRPFEEVADRIAAYLGERARRTATAQYLARLISRAEIAGIAIAGAGSHRAG